MFHFGQYHFAIWLTISLIIVHQYIEPLSALRFHHKDGIKYLQMVLSRQQNIFFKELYFCS